VFGNVAGAPSFLQALDGRDDSSWALAVRFLFRSCFGDVKELGGSESKMAETFRAAMTSVGTEAKDQSI